MTCYRLLALTTLLLPLAASAAQERSSDTAFVEPIIVSATRTPIARGALPVAVTVISGDDLRARGITTVAEALRDVTSAYVAQSGSPGATTSLFLRGGESKYVKVMVDGVAANDPGGTYDFASLTTDNVERIEIVRGPASVIYGADAVSGVVNVITRAGAGDPRVDAAISSGIAPRQRVAGTSAGSMHLVDASAGLRGAMASGSYALTIARHQSTGLYAVNNHYQNNVLGGRFAFHPGSGTDVRLSLRYTDYQFNYPTNSGGVPTDSNAYRTEDRTVIGVELEHAITAGTRAVLALSSSVNDGGTDDQTDPDAAMVSTFVSQDKVRRRGAELRLTALAGSLASLTLGAALEQQDQRSQSQSESAFGPFNSVFRAARRNLGAYAEAVLTPADPLTVTLGVRVDDNEQFGTFGTGRAGLSWRPLAATRLRATAGTAFREPSFFENYSTGFVLGNPGLHPERTRGFDAGVDQELFAGRAALSATAFLQRFRDMIDYDPSNGACGFSYCNVAQAESRGVEGEVSATLAAPLSAALGVTLLRTRVMTPGYDVSSGGLYQRGQSLIRRPDVKWTGQVSYRGAGALSATLHVLAVGTRQDRDFRVFPSLPVTLPAYRRFDVSSAYDLRGRAGALAGATLTLRVENIGDTRYEDVFNFLTPRRTLSLGVRVER